MKKILCYGDSNTFGLIPGFDARYSQNERWSGVLSTLLKDNFDVIEQGLNDRNGFIQNPKGPEYCALENLPILLEQNSDIDIIILALGTNDLQFTYDYDKNIVTNGLLKLIEIVKQHNKTTEIIIVPPVKLDKYATLGTFAYQFNDISVARSEQTFDLYKQIAKNNNCYYFDFNEISRPSDTDGLHYTPDSHNKIAKELAQYIKLNVLN